MIINIQALTPIMAGFMAMSFSYGIINPKPLKKKGAITDS